MGTYPTLTKYCGPLQGFHPGLLSFNFCHVNTNVGSARPGFQKLKKIYFPSTEVYHINYTENISLTEQSEH